MHIVKYHHRAYMHSLYYKDSQVFQLFEMLDYLRLNGLYFTHSHES